MSSSCSLHTDGVMFPSTITSEVSSLFFPFTRKPYGDSKKGRKFAQIDIMKNSVVVAVSTTSLVSGRKLKAHGGIRHAVFSSGRGLPPYPAPPLHPLAPRQSDTSALHPTEAYSGRTSSSQVKKYSHNSIYLIHCVN